MCEMPSAFQSVTRKAAKQHKCCECGKTIEKGEQYQYSSGIWDGRPASYKQCANCYSVMCAVASSVYDSEEGASFGDLREWFYNFVSVGFTGKVWVKRMAKQIGVDPQKLSLLLGERM